MKKATESINSSIYQIEDRISELEAKTFEIPLSENKEKRIKKNSKLNLHDQWTAENKISELLEFEQADTDNLKK